MGAAVSRNNFCRPTLCVNLVRFRPVTPEITRAEIDTFGYDTSHISRQAQNKLTLD